jgi:hypothetical protein
MFIESEGDELRYRSVHISEVCIAENAHGLVDTVFRKALLTAQQAVQRFGAAVLPEKIVDDARERPDALHEFVHLARPATIQRVRAGGTGQKRMLPSASPTHFLRLAAIVRARLRNSSNIRSFSATGRVANCAR